MKFKKGDRVKLLEIKNKDLWPFELYPATTGEILDWVPNMDAYWVMDDEGLDWYVVEDKLEKVD